MTAHAKLPIWNHRKWGSALDPIHKSDLNGITGDYGCERQFQLGKQRDAAEGVERGGDREPRVNARAAAGNAVHEVKSRVLSAPDIAAGLCAGTYQVAERDIAIAYQQEWRREVGNREIDWRDDRPDKLAADRVAMITRSLNNLHRYAASVIATEAAFIVRSEDGYWLSGHVDLLYAPKNNPIGIGMADWKSGKQKPSQIELDHGWESGIYSLAVSRGHFLQRSEIECRERPEGGWEALARGHGAYNASRYRAEQRAAEAALIDYAVAFETAEALAKGTTVDLDFGITYGQFPDEIHHVHLADFVPYAKSGDKTIERPEDCAFFGVQPGTKRRYTAGEQRGGAWCPVRRTEHDIPRLNHQLRTIVGTLRLGRFAERVGERCGWCWARNECLTTGYGLRGDDAREMERRLRAAVGNDTFDELSEAI